MYNNNGRPLTRRQTVRIFILFTLLAWATQTLLRQWAHGQDAMTGVAVDVQSGSKFVPGSTVGGATLELRTDATVYGSDVKLSQIARWSDADKTMVAPIADLVVARLSQGSPYKTVTLEELRGVLSDAGANMAAIRLTGATRCTISRADVHFNEGEALTKWLDARDPKSATPAEPTQAVGAPAEPQPVIAVAPMPADHKSNPEPVHTLRQRLIEDIASHLHVPTDTLQVDWNPKDDRVLGLEEGVFKFGLQPTRLHDLGAISYDITIVNNGNSQKVTISAQARAWEQQAVVMRPLAYKQVIRAEDLQTHRTLVDQLSQDTLVTAEQAIGQQASRDLKPGMLLTAKMIEAPPLVHTGQLVTITYTQGAVQLRSVARAMEGGTYGQAIRAKNDTTGAVFDVILTGPQTATMGGNTNAATPPASNAKGS